MIAPTFDSQAEWQRYSAELANGAAWGPLTAKYFQQARNAETGNRVIECFRTGFADLAELEKRAPDLVDAIVSAIVAHLRSWRPESVSPLGSLPTPEGPTTDPRETV